MTGDRLRTVLSVSGLHVDFVRGADRVRAVSDVTFRLERGTRTAVLGESGCGKTVTALAVFRLLPGNGRVTGGIRFNREDILNLDPGRMAELRGRDMVLLPQNPQGRLNPFYTAGFHVKESICRVGPDKKHRLKDRALCLLSKAGIEEPGRIYGSYPLQLSGGTAQRVVLAMTLAADPDLVIADEPTKGLDHEARGRFLGLSETLYSGSAYLMITHDLDAARTCERCMVMYAGTIVEDGPAGEVLSNPRHPYTLGLVSSHPSKGLVPMEGGPPSVTKASKGCDFYSRCGMKTPVCRRETPRVRESGAVEVRCHHA